MKKHNSFKKVLSLILVFSLVIGMIPMTTFASEDMVYISVSYDDKYIVDKNGDYIAKVGVPMAEVEAIDLEAYGLGDYLYDQDGDGEYETTALQLVIYAHENIYGGNWSDVTFSGWPGSSYFEGGIFGFDENLNYFLNGEFPLLYDGWGATSDQIVLYPGDFLDIGSFSSWDFYSDSNYGFHFFANESGELYHEYTVEEGKDLTVKLQRSYSGMGVGALLYDEADYNVYYGTAYNHAMGTKTTDSSGMITFNFENAGTYYIWADGGYGMEFPDSIVSTPAFAKVIVTEPLGPSQEEIDKAAADAVIAKIDAIGEVTLASEDKITAARGAYDGLTDDQKALVTNYNVLTAAEQELSKLKVDKVAAESVITKIEAIGEVTLASEDKITAARDAYDALTDDQKTLVTNYNTLTDAEQKQAKLKADKEAAENVITKIDAIGVVTLDSAASIAVARAEYDDLTDEQKAIVTNYEVLTDAEAKLEELLETAEEAEKNKAAADAVAGKIEAIGEVTLASEDKIVAARDAYDALTDEQKALVTNYDTLTEAEQKLEDAKADKAAADNVVAKIEAIGEVTLDSEDKIATARDAYDALTDEQKALVTNYDLLTEAEQKLEDAKADKAAADMVVAKIEAIGEVTLDSEDKIAAVRDAYDALTDEQKTLVTNYDTLTEAEAELDRLQAEKEEADKKVEEDKAAAGEVDSLIDNIGTVNIYNVKRVYEARNAYDNLTDAQKAYVENLDVLIEAEEILAEMYEDASTINHKEIYEKTHEFLSGLGTPTVGSTGGEWMVIDFTRAGYDCPEGYYENVEEFVKANINDKEQLHRSKSTENSRVILALTSAGYDVTDVAGHNLLMGLTDMDYVKKQGVNGPIWALIAFDSYGYEIPVNEDANEQVTREGLIQYILDKRVDDGGWNLILSSPVNDPDMTGMAIQALAPYYDTNPKVKEAIDGALETLSNTQHESGGFSSTDGICSESCAQVIVALTTLGINPETDARFVKNGISVVDAMCLFAMEDGGFAHIPYAGINGMATEQCQYALASYYRFLDGKTSLYDMSDVELRSEDDVISDDDTILDDGTTSDGNVAPDDNTTPEGNVTPNDTPGTEGGEGNNNDMNQPSDDMEDVTINDSETVLPEEDNAKPVPETTPATGDNNNLVAWISLMGMALCGMTISRRKNN